MKTPRQIAVADHLWETFARMARDMGADRESLVNQALHVFARLNGYGVPGAPDAERAPAGPPRPPPPPRAAEAEQVLEAAARLERDIQELTPPGTALPGSLVLVREDGTTLDVAKDRFVIGRGRHCDLVIDSAKVSREHAAIVRDGGGWAIEDLGSSNGTWHQRERVERRRIADGDEYYVCSEKLRCVLR